MKRYEYLWRGFWSVIGVFAVGLAALEWSAIGVVVGLVLLVGVGALLIHLVPAELPVLAAWARRGRTLPRAVSAAVSIVTVWSFSLLSPPLAVLVVLLAFVTAPVVVSRAVRSARGSTTAPVPQEAEETAPAEDVDEKGDVGADADEAVELTQPEALGPLKGLDDRQLCRLWRESFWILSVPAPPGTVLRIVALREACLDELEHRHGAGIRAWLESGARASSGPDKYLDER